MEISELSFKQVAVNYLQFGDFLYVCVYNCERKSRMCVWKRGAGVYVCDLSECVCVCMCVCARVIGREAGCL